MSRHDSQAGGCHPKTDSKNATNVQDIVAPIATEMRMQLLFFATLYAGLADSKRIRSAGIQGPCCYRYSYLSFSSLTSLPLN